MSTRFGRSAAGLLLFLTSATLLLPGAGLAQEPDDSEATAPQVIAIIDSDFEPQVVQVLTNQTVTWTHQGSLNHDVTSIEEGGPLLSPRDMQGGSTYEFKFNNTGVYDYYCTLHSSGRGNAMWGRIVVVAGEVDAVAGGAAHGPSPEEFGVRWLAHWVGIISFIAVIAVLVVYYFVLKYGETVHATDHRDRKEK